MLRCSNKLSQRGILLLLLPMLAGCAVLGDPPPVGPLAGEDRIMRERPWPNLADVPAAPRPGSTPDEIAALRAELESERQVPGPPPACPPGQAGGDGICVE